MFFFAVERTSIAIRDLCWPRRRCSRQLNSQSIRSDPFGRPDAALVDMRMLALARPTLDWHLCRYH
jgi:hypothetical protein